MKNNETCQVLNSMLTGYNDGELTQQESQWVARHLAQCSSCAADLKEMQSIQQNIASTNYPKMEQEKMAKVLNDLTSQRIQGLSWSLVFISIVMAVMLMMLGIYEFWLDTSMHWFEKLAISFGVGGGVGLFVSVLRQRLIIRKNDKYKGVDL